MKRILILFFLISLISCDNSKTVITEYSNGQKRIVIYPNKSDTTNYTHELYYSNGQLSEKGVVKDNKMDGEWIWYYENGQKKDEATLDFGRYYGERKHWYENGKPKLFECLREDDYADSCCSCTGRFVFFFEDGSKQENNKENGILQGEIIEWYPNGKIHMKGWLENELKHGKWEIYDSLGILIRVEKYNLGELIKDR